MNYMVLTGGMIEFLILSIIVAVLIYGFREFTDHQDRMAIKIRKDGRHEYERISSKPKIMFPLWLKIAIFIVIASVLFMPLDFILNRS
ncbi:hypothetical protein [Nonlabens antarcticus]|uniref:hypothetical protein n=1 Tax=Nonlabens antarcticus TaxID=392714 RepID=UPI001890DC65|nr:hypothetical protein [Nonlabens antarcticus]